jgi:hypothetical protein
MIHDVNSFHSEAANSFVQNTFFSLHKLMSERVIVIQHKQIFQLYHGENKLNFNWMMIFALF